MKTIELIDVQEEALRYNMVFCVNDQVYTAKEIATQLDWHNTSYDEMKSCMCEIPDIVIKKSNDGPDVWLNELSETLQDGIRYAISHADYWRDDWTL